VLRYGLFPDFLGTEDRLAAAIHEWPGEVLPCVQRGLLALQAHRPLAADDRAELLARGLIGPDGGLSEQGRKVGYHLAEYVRQARGDFVTADVLQRVGLEADARVLDVGCGAGQSLHLLAGRRPAELVGLDSDLEALLLGCRLAEATGEDLRFVRASAHALPFGDGRFTHVLSRVALNYMHQRLALGEMARVLRPGGVLYCRVAGLGQDAAQLAEARSARVLMQHLRDLAMGLVLEATGRQALPGGRYTSGYAFATARRIGRNLRLAGCEIISVSVLRRYAWLPRNVEVLARKRHAGPR
jgi:SAM-dependent methyltransferase